MYKGVLIAVKDMEESKKFYHDILDMNVADDLTEKLLKGEGNEHARKQTGHHKSR